MKSQNALFFKLNYSGEIDEFTEKSDDPVEFFSSVSIIPVYVRSSKKLFTWVGNNASQTLKSYIGQFRELFSKKHDDLRVLRYITVEAKSEPYDFFESTGLSKDKLWKRLEDQEDKLKPVVSKISQLKQEADEFLEAAQYEKAIITAETIKELAVQIEDSSLKQDQEEFISEAHNRAEAKKIFGEINQETETIKNKLDHISSSNDMVEIHDQTENFKKKFKKYANLMALPDVAEVLTKENKVWQDYEATKDQLSQLDELEAQFNTSFNANDLKSLKEIVEKAKPLVAGSLDSDLKNKWAEREKEMNGKTENAEVNISNLEDSLHKAEESNNLAEVIRIGEELLVIGTNDKREDILNKYQPIVKDAKEKLKQSKTTELAKQQLIEQKAKATEKTSIDMDKYRKEGLSALNDDNLIGTYNAFEKVVEIVKEYFKDQ